MSAKLISINSFIKKKYSPKDTIKDYFSKHNKYYNMPSKLIYYFDFENLKISMNELYQDISIYILDFVNDLIIINNTKLIHILNSSYKYIHFDTFIQLFKNLFYCKEHIEGYNFLNHKKYRSYDKNQSLKLLKLGIKISNKFDIDYKIWKTHIMKFALPCIIN